jgi:hypothetical protein
MAPQPMTPEPPSDRPLESSGTMPVGAWPVNDAPGAARFDLMTAAGQPPLRFHPSKLPAKDAPGIWPQCGAARLEWAAAARPKRPPAAPGRRYFCAAEIAGFQLTMLRGEAYIRPLGAPSAIGVIARL